MTITKILQVDQVDNVSIFYPHLKFEYGYAFDKWKVFITMNTLLNYLKFSYCVLIKEYTDSCLTTYTYIFSKECIRDSKSKK
jgi:hypothetical protein